MSSVPIEVLLGIYLGILTGILPALAAWSLGFIFKYFTGVTIPGFGVVVLAVALAGVNGGLLALADPTITESANAVTIITAIIVVLMLSLYAHSRGDAMGATFPKRLSLKELGERTLSKEVLDGLGGRGEARVRATGEVADMEGYPPLSDDLRAELRGGEWTFPAHLTIAELEARLADRLRAEHDLGDVGVRIDERGRATIAAAPPFSGLSKRVPDGKRAVSVDALLPTGVARSDEVTLRTADAEIRGTVVSARTRDAPAAEPEPEPDPTTTDEAVGEAESPPQSVRAPTTTGGEGRITVAVSRGDVEPLLRADRARVVVESRGVRREYELVSLLRRAGRRFRRLTVGAGSDLDGEALDDAAVRETYGVAVLAVRRTGGWAVAPRDRAELSGGDELFVVGTRDGLERFAEVVA